MWNKNIETFIGLDASFDEASYEPKPAKELEPMPLSSSCKPK